MLLQKRLGIFSLIGSTIFVLVIGLEFLGAHFDMSLFWIFRPLGFFMSWPLYLFIFIAFLFNGYKWISQRNRENFKYLLYTVLSGVMVVGTLFVILITLAKALENF